MNWYTWEDSDGDWHGIIAKNSDRAVVSLALDGKVPECIMLDEEAPDYNDDTPRWLIYLAETLAEMEILSRGERFLLHSIAAYLAMNGIE